MSPRRQSLFLPAGMLMLLTACGGENLGTAEGGTSDDGGVSLGHVHGLGTNPADGSVYAATHLGVFNLGEPGAWQAERVADRWQDTMAFTVAGPDHFLASGHPDQREDLPPHLGLIESTDAARTWDPVSLRGEADFHALEVAGNLLYGYDSLTGQLMVTNDREAWRTVAEVPVADLAADPTTPGRVLASTADGVVAYTPDGGPGQPLEGAPPVLLLDWPTEDLLVGVAGDGVVYRSSDAGDTWQRSEGPPGDLQALDVTSSTWYIATSAGIFRSADDGRTWQPLAPE